MVVLLHLIKLKLTVLFVVLNGVCAVFSASIYANTIVKVDIQQGAVSNDTVFIKLFDEHAPLTVNNFLKYIDDGDFNDLLFHRSASSFVVQSGLLTYDKNAVDNRFIACESCNPASSLVDYDFPAGLQLVPLDPTINNEGGIGLSNLRGTLTMALEGTDPNSANSQWFVNLADNNDPLDFASGSGGPFTVFGELINDAITVFDEIALHPVYDRSQDIHLLFRNLPLVNYTAAPIVDDNLVKITTIEKQFKISVVYDHVGGVVGTTKAAEDVDFGILRVGTAYTAEITLSNVSGSNLVIDGVIAPTIGTGLLYSMNDGCGTTGILSAGSSCLILLQVTPDAEGVFEDSIIITFTTPVLDYELTIHSEATSIPAAGDIEITPSDLIDFGAVAIYDPSQGAAVSEFITIKNAGNLDLNILDLTLTGKDVTDFEFQENCLANNPRERNSRNCVMQILFKPLSLGNKTVVATITSDDSDESVLQVVISGGGDSDNDGVSAVIENSAPNNGDSNNDSILDSLQNHVVSVQMTNGDYATYVFDEAQSFLNFDLVPPESLINPPNNVVLNDVYSFRLGGVPASFFGERAKMGIYLPVEISPKVYYMYGSTPDDPNPHWYDFKFDGFTGAQLFTNVEVLTQNGTKIKRSLIVLNFVDGQRGDSDLLPNGKIVAQGSYVATAASQSSGSSQLSLIVLLSMFFLIRACRNFMRE